MKAKALLCLCCIVAAVGCTKDDTIMLLSLQEQNQSTRLDGNPFDFYKFSDSAIVLGAKLLNPYSVANLQIARDSLIAEGATPSSLPAINVTHYYARFKPADDDALAELIDRDTTIIYYEFPLDYEIKEYGISYHDPAIADTLPTYQYASVPILKWQNLQNIPNVECTLLEPLCILDEDKDGSTGWDGVEPRDSLPKLEPDPRDTLPFKPINPIDTTKLNSNNGLNRIQTNGNYDESAISALMSKSFELTGNGDYEEPSMTRASSKWRPAGNIHVYDDVAGFIPLVGAKVLAKRWFTTYSGITDGLGNFTCNGKFKNPANYSIKWQRGKYSVLDGSVCQAYYNGPKIKGDWNLDIADGKSVRFATIHRAAHLMFYGQHELTAPNTASKLTIKYFHSYNSQKGGDYRSSLKRVRIWGKSREDDGSVIWSKMSLILAITMHELGHAAHHTNAKNNYVNSEKRHKESWACFVQYYLTYLEYENLGRYESYCFWDDNRECYEPDFDKHNRQQWRNNIDKSHTKHYTYTPIYIDLYDNFNQRAYYHNSVEYPYDEIHITDISLLQNMIFKSKSFSEVAQQLHNYINTHSDQDYEKFGLTTHNVNTLFQDYEK